MDIRQRMEALLTTLEEQRISRVGGVSGLSWNALPKEGYALPIAPNKFEPPPSDRTALKRPARIRKILKRRR